MYSFKVLKELIDENSLGIYLSPKPIKNLSSHEPNLSNNTKIKVISNEL